MYACREGCTSPKSEEDGHEGHNHRRLLQLAAAEDDNHDLDHDHGHDHGDEEPHTDEDVHDHAGHEHGDDEKQHSDEAEDIDGHSGHDHSGHEHGEKGAATVLDAASLIAASRSANATGMTAQL